MAHVTKAMVVAASRKYAYYKKHGLAVPPVPTKDIWGNDLPKPPAFPGRKGVGKVERANERNQ